MRRAIYLLWLVLGPSLSVPILAAEAPASKVFKRFPIESAVILYDVNTTGTSAGLQTRTLGVARMVFDHWGARELKEEDVTEVQTGDFNETRNKHSLSLIDYGTIYSVDYDENITYKTRDREMDMAIAQGKDLSDENFAFLKEIKATRAGSQTIAGLTCDRWTSKDQEVCLYQGIPLYVRIDTEGFHSVRTAVHAVINKPVAESEFALPAFPLIIDEEYTTNESAHTRSEDYLLALQDLKGALSRMSINPADTNYTLTPAQEREVINVLGQRYLAKQKRLLPKLKSAFILARQCLREANASVTARACIDPVNAINEALGDKTINFVFDDWNATRRDAVLRAMDQEMKYLDVTLKCVEEHNRTTDVIECTEGRLLPAE